jgi:hypothetical protein
MPTVTEKTWPKLPITPETLTRMRQWGEADPRIKNIMPAYLDLWAEAKYRFGAPSDGWGNLLLDDDQLADPVRLEIEAWCAARQFIEADDQLTFEMRGCSHFEHAKTMFLAFQAAQLCCGGVPHVVIRRVLELAIKALPDDPRQQAV